MAKAILGHSCMTDILQIFYIICKWTCPKEIIRLNDDIYRSIYIIVINFNNYNRNQSDNQFVTNIIFSKLATWESLIFNERIIFKCWLRWMKSVYCNENTILKIILYLKFKEKKHEMYHKGPRGPLTKWREWNIRYFHSFNVRRIIFCDFEQTLCIVLHQSIEHY